MHSFSFVLAQMPTADTGATEFFANLSVGTIVMVAAVLTAIRLMLLSFKAPAPRGRPAEVLPFARSIAEILESLIIASVLVFLIIRPFFVQAFYIPSESMENTLLGHDTGVRNHTDTVHDHIFVNKLAYRFGEPQHGDIIVFRAPLQADMESKMKGLPQVENILIKRLIGLPGDTIEVKDGAVYRNGERLTEPYIKEKMDDPQPAGAEFAVRGPLKLGPNQIFAMGDNRNDSNDSRYWGPLERNRVIGKAAFIFFPFNRIRSLSH